MTSPGLSSFMDQPFNSATKVNLIDLFTGDGVTESFTMINKTGPFIGASAEVDTVLFPRESGAMTVVSNTATLNTAPLVAQQILFPGANSIAFSASDQNDAIGRVFERYWFIADVDTIQFYQYSAVPGDSGIRVEFAHAVTLDTSLPAWFQLAAANPDGTVGTYGAPGAPLFLNPISAQDTFQGNKMAGDTTVTVADGSQFNAGEYIYISPSLVNAEQIKIISILGNVLTVAGTGFQYAHTAGETLYTCGVKVWGKMTVPLNAAGGVMQTFYGTPLRRKAKVIVRP